VRLEEVARAEALDCDTIEIWFADEARIGQKNKTTRRWAKRGTRPSAPRDQRTASTYIFGAAEARQGRSPDPAGLQYRSDESAPRGDRRSR
jgi:putative transposase